MQCQLCKKADAAKTVGVGKEVMFMELCEPCEGLVLQDPRPREQILRVRQLVKKGNGV